MQTSPEFKTLHIVDHPLVQHKLSALRETSCPFGTFRRLLGEISMLMAYELTASMPLTTRHIETPLTGMDAPTLKNENAVLVPILRAGLGMVDGLMKVLPDAVIGHIGLYRDEETHRPVEYLVRLPKKMPAGTPYILIDPMLATGNSARYATDILVREGVSPSDIRLMTLVSAPEGVKEYSSAHPDVAIFTAALDSHLNDKAYIVPGLGDAGDRVFGTL
jgi:uracil phosphoribosyltransferase